MKSLICFSYEFFSRKHESGIENCDNLVLFAKISEKLKITHFCEFLIVSPTLLPLEHVSSYKNHLKLWFFVYFSTRNTNPVLKKAKSWCCMLHVAKNWKLHVFCEFSIVFNFSFSSNFKLVAVALTENQFKVRYHFSYRKIP